MSRRERTPPPPRGYPVRRVGVSSTGEPILRNDRWGYTITDPYSRSRYVTDEEMLSVPDYTAKLIDDYFGHTWHYDHSHYGGGDYGHTATAGELGHRSRLLEGIPFKDEESENRAVLSTVFRKSYDDEGVLSAHHFRGRHDEQERHHAGTAAHYGRVAIHQNLNTLEFRDPAKSYLLPFYMYCRGVRHPDPLHREAGPQTQSHWARLLAMQITSANVNQFLRGNAWALTMTTLSLNSAELQNAISNAMWRVYFNDGTNRVYVFRAW